jgi:hypothetical protein
LQRSQRRSCLLEQRGQSATLCLPRTGKLRPSQSKTRSPIESAKPVPMPLLIVKICCVGGILGCCSTRNGHPPRDLATSTLGENGVLIDGVRADTARGSVVAMSEVGDYAQEWSPPRR